MVELRLACEAGDAGRNEDLALATPDFAAVFDGVTALPGMATGCVHDPAWYVRRLAGQLLAGHTAEPARPLTDLLATAIAAVRRDHGPDCDPSGSPQATVCLLRAGPVRTEYLVLGDSSLVLEQSGRIDVVTDQRHVEFAPKPGPLRARVPALVEARRHANQPNGYWIAAAEPEAAYHALTGAVPRDRLVRAALLTDGVSCAVDAYRLMDWAELLDLARTRGPYHVISLVRDAERADPDGVRLPRYKRHDDAAIVYCDWEPFGPVAT